MNFIKTEIPGAYIIELERLSDHRGFFARSFCEEEFRAHGLNPSVAQCSLSFNPKKGTVRGLHSQKWPHEEAKLVRCTQGAVYDVILDLRPDSDTFLRHVAVELTAENHRMLYVPEGVYHGFMTMEDNSEVFYQMSTAFHGESAVGVRWNDPAFGIKWPGPMTCISEKDKNHPDFVAPRK